MLSTLLPCATWPRRTFRRTNVSLSLFILGTYSNSELTCVLEPSLRYSKDFIFFAWNLCDLNVCLDLTGSIVSLFLFFFASPFRFKWTSIYVTKIFYVYNFLYKIFFLKYFNVKYNERYIFKGFFRHTEII